MSNVGYMWQLNKENFISQLSEPSKTFILHVTIPHVLSLWMVTEYLIN